MEIPAILQIYHTKAHIPGTHTILCYRTKLLPPPRTLTVCYFILDKLNSEGPQAKTGIIPYPDCPPLHL